MMFTLLVLTAVVVASASVAVATMANPRLQPAEYPFTPGSPDPSADTMVNQASIETVFADNGWQSVMVSSLSEAEEILDCLEAGKIEQREMITQGNASFCVRWR